MMLRSMCGTVASRSSTQVSVSACCVDEVRLMKRRWVGLQALYDKYKEKDFVIVGFPSNQVRRTIFPATLHPETDSPQFGGQEPGTDEEISQVSRSLLPHVSFTHRMIAVVLYCEPWRHVPADEEVGCKWR
jgi:hypothetical protein